MFKKCLKYDFSAVWRVWWILALVALGAGVIGCVSIRSIVSSTDTQGFLRTLLSISSVFGMIAAVLSLSVFVIMTLFLIYFRFYKHFFSDEGYLTFSLPVKRSTLYLSKVVNALIWIALSVVLIFFVVVGMILCADVGVSFSDVIEILSLKWMRGWSGAWSAVYLIEGLLIAVFVSLLQCGMIHFCITVGAVIAKKHKIIAAIGIYYAFSIVTGFVAEFVNIFASIGLIEAGANLIDRLVKAQYLPLLALLLLAICAAIATFACLLHHITLGLIERKLNLE